MSGHSKWSSIKHKKAAVDKKRGAAFHRFVKELMVASKLGGGDPSSNSRLRVALSKARAANMPRDTIERAIKKGSGDQGGQSYEEVLYEIYAPGGVGIIVEALTDKKTRTTPEIKSIVNKYGCNLAEPNAVTRLFQLRGDIIIDKNAIGEDDLMEIALEAGAEDMTTDDENHEILTLPENFAAVTEAIADKDIPVVQAEIRYLPLDGTEINVDTEEKARKLLKLLDIFEEHDDVQNLYHNMSVSNEIMTSLYAD